MSQPIHRAPLRRPVFPSDLRRLFRELARVAVASSFTVAAVSCTRYDLGQDPTPNPEIIENGASGVGGASGASGVGGAAGSSGLGGVGGVGGAGSGGFGGAGFGGISGEGGFSGTTGGSPWMEPLWEPLLCEDQLGAPALFTGMVTRPIDFAGFYRIYRGDYASEDGGLPMGTLVTDFVYGQACEGANDLTTCQQSLEVLKPTPQGCANGDACRAIITTEDDALTRIEERAALVALLGTVDTGDEAAIAAWLAGTDISCFSPNGASFTGTRTRRVEGGIEVQTRTADCAEPLSIIEVIRPDGSSEIISQTALEPTCVAGRRPEGLRSPPRVAASELGAYFASAAHLEAASVHAFVRFADELQALGAPEELVVAARRAALEEIAHTRMVGAIAERFGGELQQPQLEAPLCERDAFAIALENAVEGCVRETYGALVAWHQAQSALDPLVRQVMAQIAEDETRHAELSWRVAAWLEPQLTELERRQVSAAREIAFGTLRDDLSAASLSPAASALIGLPAENSAIALLDQLGSALSLHA